jgi:hypothetical protein
MQEVGENEIARGAMKSSLRSDEIFGVPPLRKRNSINF